VRQKEEREGESTRERGARETCARVRVCMFCAYVCMCVRVCACVCVCVYAHVRE